MNEKKNILERAIDLWSFFLWLKSQKNNREIELLCQESILQVTRDSMPIEKILRAYIDKTVDEEVLEETIEKTVEENVAKQMEDELYKAEENGKIASDDTNKITKNDLAKNKTIEDNKPIIILMI